MSLPREVLPGRFYLVTRRCTQRQLLMRPDDEMNNAFIYCLGEASERFGIEVLLTCAMSNHHHTVIYDRHGRYPDFLEHFHKMVARSLNALRGRWENFWSSAQASVVRLIDRDDVMRKLVYTATNPVKDGLVEKVHHWPGVNGMAALLSGRAMRATRPRHFFRAAGRMPETVQLRFVIPAELGESAAVCGELAQQVAQAELELASKRLQAGTRVRGRRGVLRQSWRDQPVDREPHRTLRPHVAAINVWQRVEALQRNREFLDAYRDARTRWLAGGLAKFPAGTYWLRRFAAVPLAS
jgi:putative transposase